MDYEIEDIPESIELTDIQKLDLQAFNMSATMTHREIVRALDREKNYANMSAAVADISRRVNRVAKNPARYGVSSDKAEMTKSIVVNRNSLTLNARNKEENIRNVTKKEKKTIDQLVMEGRHKSWMVLNLKLDEAMRDPNKRSKVALGEIAKVAGITFDKGQLIDGKATEHVAVMSKFDNKDISREDAMNAVLKMRELNESQSEDQK